MARLNPEDIPREFRNHVENVLTRERMGEEADERAWGQTPMGQYFVLVTSKVSYKQH